MTAPAEVDMQAFDWSRDGRAILGACRNRESRRFATCLVHLSDQTEEGDTIRLLASDPNRNLFNQRFSPDQRWISFLAHNMPRDSTSAVYVMPADGGQWIQITDGKWFDDKPRWSPDSRLLYFVSNRGRVANVWGRRFDPFQGKPVGEPFAVTSFTSRLFALTPRTVQMDIAVTTSHLILPIGESVSDIWMIDQVDR